jgi:hypothetical protein
MIARTAMLVVTACLVGATGVRGQGWDVPSFLPPRPGDDLGVYVTNQGQWGIQGIWRSSGLGVRGGYVSTGGSGALLIGAETFGRFIGTEGTFPVDVAFTLGGGATFASFTLIRVAAGASLGAVWPFGGLTVQPYVHPRLALDLLARGDDLATRFPLLVDVGADLAMGEGLKIRIGASLTEDTAFGVGVAFQMARGVAVR